MKRLGLWQVDKSDPVHPIHRASDQRPPPRLFYRTDECQRRFPFRSGWPSLGRGGIGRGMFISPLIKLHLGSIVIIVSLLWFVD